MSAQTHAPAEHAPHGHGGGDHAAHDDKYYVKIWAILLVLLIISFLGPKLGIQALTLITAFGIAFVKAYLVIKNFMHIGVERKWIVYLMVTMLSMMVLMLAGIGPDVQRHQGERWENVSAKQAVERGLKAQQAGEGHGHHGDGHAPAPEH